MISITLNPTSVQASILDHRAPGKLVTLLLYKYKNLYIYPEYSVDSQLSKSQTKKQERKIREITLKQLRNKL